MRSFLASVLLAAAGAAHAAPWWSAFHDATLNLVLASADEAPPAQRLQAQAQLAVDYVQLRAATSRLVTARMLADTLQREQQLVEAGSEEARRVAPLLQEAQARVQRFEQLRSGALAALAGHAAPRRSPEDWAALLEPVLVDPRPTLPDFELPRQVSGLVLRRRADVAGAETELARDGRSSGAEQLRLARYLQALATPITADADALPLPGLPQAPEDVLGRARSDVARRLAILTACERAAREQLALLQKLQPAYAQLEQSFRQGGVTAQQTLEAFSGLLVEEDRMAAANGQLALAWIAWQAGIGGAGDASTSELLGAGSP